MSKVVIEVSLDAESKALLNAAVAALAGGTAAPAAKAKPAKAKPAKAAAEDEDDFDDVEDADEDADVEDADEDADEDAADEDDAGDDEVTVDNVGEALKAYASTPGSSKALAVKLLKDKGGVAALSALKPAKFQTVIDAANAAVAALKKKAKAKAK